MDNRLIFRQLFDPSSSTYTYLLADPDTGDAVIIDPVLEQLERDSLLLKDLGLSLIYSIDTHIHADHITGSGQLRKRTGCHIVSGEGTQLKCADRLMADGEELTFGTRKLKAIATPGHTEGCTSFFIDDRVFTGDTLLIRSCGRTDFQGGSATKLYQSIKNKLYKLPPQTIVYPAHDYLGNTSSTLQEEMQYNKRVNLETTEKEFLRSMEELNLPYPQKIDTAVPANQECGNVQFTEIIPEKVKQENKNFILVDVRSQAEFDEGHIEGSTLATLGHDLMKYLSKADPTKSYVFICRIGQRSGQAQEIARGHHFKNAYSLKGGITAWEKHQYPIVKSS
jgi:sulfur dioxygenase